MLKRNTEKFSLLVKRMRAVAKDNGLRLVMECKHCIPASANIDGKRIMIAPVATFPTIDAVALVFCHELGHHYIWKGQTELNPINGFHEELLAWFFGIEFYGVLFKGLRLKPMNWKNFVLRRYIVCKLATYTGMFNIRCEGFFDKGPAGKYRVGADGRLIRLSKHESLTGGSPC